MRRRDITIKSRDLTALAVTLALATGCTPKLTTSGEDSDYLKDLTPAKSELTSTQLFPLAPGNYWEMNGQSESGRFRTKIVADATKPVLGTTGIHLNLLRDGAIWRQEVYRNDAKGLFLLAYGEKKSDLLVLDPPLQLTKADIIEGDDLSWSGVVRFQGKAFPAVGYSRISNQETVTTRKGRLQAYRLDSVITLTRPGEKPLHFPSIRWLSKGIGLVRRSYADGGKPALEDIDQYMVKGG